MARLGPSSLSWPNPHKRRPLPPRRSPSRPTADLSRRRRGVGGEHAFKLSPTGCYGSSGGNSVTGSTGRHSPHSSRGISPKKIPWYYPGRRATARQEGDDSSGDQRNAGVYSSSQKDGAYGVHANFRHRHMEAESVRDRLINGEALGRASSRRCRDEVKEGPPLPSSGAKRLSSPQHDDIREEQQNEHAPMMRTSRRYFHRSEVSRPPRVFDIEVRQTPSSRGLLTRGGDSLSSPCFSRRTTNVENSRQKQHRGEAIEAENVDIQRDRADRVTGSVLQRSHTASRNYGPSSTEARGNGVGADTGPLVCSHKGTTKPTVYSGHEGQVLALARHEDLLFSSAADGTAKVEGFFCTVELTKQAWDTHTRECLATYEGHRRAIWCVQVTGQTLITGGADGTVRFWDIETTQPLHVLDLHLPVRDVVMVGDFLAAATSSADIEIIDLNGMKRHHKLEGHLLAVSALASLDGGTRLVSGSHDTFIRIWNLQSGSCECTLGGHSGTIGKLCTITPPPNGLTEIPVHTTPNVTKRDELIISGSGDATIRIWGRGAEREKERQWASLAVLEGHRHGIWAMDASSKLGIFASGGSDATVKVWAPTARLSSQYLNGRASNPETKERTACNFDPGRGAAAWGHAWECAGGVRGTVGAVGAVLLTEGELKFGTSEALIANFPLQFCMPVD